VHRPGEQVLNQVGRVFDLDLCAVEGAVTRGQQAKIEQHGEMTFLVVRTARNVEHEELTETSEIVEIRRPHAVHRRALRDHGRHGEANGLGAIVELEQNAELRVFVPWAPIYAIPDRILDTYVDVAEHVEVDIDQVETSVLARRVHGRIARSYQLKRELVEFKRAVMPRQRPRRRWLTAGCGWGTCRSR
jgi:magnesium transporter